MIQKIQGWSDGLLQKWNGLFFLLVMLSSAGVGILFLYLLSMADRAVGAQHLLYAKWFTFQNPHFRVALIPPLLVLAVLSLLVIVALVLMAVNLALYLLMLPIGILPVGWRLTASSVWNEVTVESAPLGKWNLVTLFPRSDNQGGGVTICHMPIH